MNISLSKWMLIISTTMLSTSILMNQSQFYMMGLFELTLFSSMFHIILTPIFFQSLYDYLPQMITLSAILAVIGQIIQYFATNDNIWCTISIMIISTAYAIITAAPYGLLNLFKLQHRGYVASIQLFVPTIISNVLILCVMKFTIIPKVTINYQCTQFKQINNIITLFGIISMVLTIFFVCLLKNEINKLKEQNISQKNNEIIYILTNKSIMEIYKKFPTYIIKLVCWGSMIGISITYGSLYELYKEIQYQQTDPYMINLIVNLSSLSFSICEIWIINRTKYQRLSIIYTLMFCASIASIFIFIDALSSNSIFHHKIILIIAIITVKIGCTGFVVLSLMQFAKLYNAPHVYSINILFWIANLTNLISMKSMELLKNKMLSLGGLCIIILLCTISIQKEKDNKQLYKIIENPEIQQTFQQKTEIQL